MGEFGGSSLIELAVLGVELIDLSEIFYCYHAPEPHLIWPGLNGGAT